MAMIQPKVGMMLYGYCGGCFGRDSYDNKRIEVIGYDYIVCRNEEGFPEFYANYDKEEVLIDEEWLKETDND